MKTNEIKKALKLLGDRVERHATWAVSGSKQEALSVDWIDGGSRVFHLLDEVYRFVENRAEVD